MKQGFTLIEVMIVVAVIGVLAALGILAYQDYNARAQMAEAVEMLASGKTPLAEYFSNRGYWPSTPSSVMGNVGPGKYFNSIAYAAGSPAAPAALTVELVATMNASNVSKLIQNSTMVLVTGDGGKTWWCSNGANPPAGAPVSPVIPANSVDTKYLPTACK